MWGWIEKGGGWSMGSCEGCGRSVGLCVRCYTIRLFLRDLKSRFTADDLLNPKV